MQNCYNFPWNEVRSIAEGQEVIGGAGGLLTGRERVPPHPVAHMLFPTRPIEVQRRRLRMVCVTLLFGALALVCREAMVYRHLAERLF
jgi:hypothetical protein